MTLSSPLQRGAVTRRDVLCLAFVSCQTISCDSRWLKVGDFSDVPQCSYSKRRSYATDCHFVQRYRGCEQFSVFDLLGISTLIPLSGMTKVSSCALAGLRAIKNIPQKFIIRNESPINQFKICNSAL